MNLPISFDLVIKCCMAGVASRVLERINFKSGHVTQGDWFIMLR